MIVRYYGPRDRSKKFWIGVYDAELTLIVCNDIKRAYKRTTGQDYGSDESPAGLATYNGNRFQIYISRDYLNHNVIAHEAHHISHRIMAATGAKLNNKTKEPFAYLHGHIVELVYKQLKKWKLKVK